MVALSFQPMFVEPVRVGLGERRMHRVIPKRHTIRKNGKRRHPRPGETLQLYCRQRHPQGFKIGDARCVGSAAISIHFRKRRNCDWFTIGDGEYATHFIPPTHGKFDRPNQLNEFARSDGFRDWSELRVFWDKHHHGVTDFVGRIIFWEPLTPEARAA